MWSAVPCENDAANYQDSDWGTLTHKPTAAPSSYRRLTVVQDSEVSDEPGAKAHVAASTAAAPLATAPEPVGLHSLMKSTAMSTDLRL